jgi:predicted nucleic acid-binding protein
MTRVSFAPNPPDPRRTLTFLDSCAFDPKYDPEDAASNHMLSLYRDEKIVLVISHSVESELEHPNTPRAIVQLANDMNRTHPVDLTLQEQQRLQGIKSELSRHARPGKHEADACHIFDAGKWHAYFVTTDERILKRRTALQFASQATILRPTEWVAIHNASLEWP